MSKKHIVLNLILFLFTTAITILISGITIDRLIEPLRLGYFGVICYKIFLSYCLYLLIIWICINSISLFYKKIFLYLYIALITGFLLSRHSDIALINLQLGKIDDYSVLTLIGNMFMFLPVSYLMKYLYKIKTMYTILFISISIIILEVLQYILRKGCLDINDIILNIFGAVLGVVLYNVADRNSKIKQEKR